jgi:hypothetical protein
VGSQSHIHLRRAKKVCDGASKQARWTSIVSIAQNRSSVRLPWAICHTSYMHMHYAYVTICPMSYMACGFYFIGFSSFPPH